MMRTTSHSGDIIYIYKHGATQATRTLPAPNSAYSCAVDPRSRDLAVTTEVSTVAIYRHSRGTPQVYPAHSFTGYPAYDDAGNLYLARPAGGYYEVAVLTNGTLHSIKFDQEIFGLVHLQWLDGLLVVTTHAHGGSQNYHQDVYAIQINGSYQGHVVQSLALDRKNREEPPKTPVDWVEGDALMAPGHNRGALDFWNYPGGGDPERSVRLELVDGYFTGMVMSP
ncbi:MAG TPA: hypothetical protein VHR97_03460 [Candidatus Baltobacteraceae bacterium]|nr:hypothetical protein [Candidatus Baltobacteraceae bacterium]